MTFYEELQQNLPHSTGAQRTAWAAIITAQDLNLQKLSGLLLKDYAIASRFLWLLSDVGMANPAKLHEALPFLLDLRDQLSHLQTEASFANYWLIAGVPEINEGQAIDLLFSWLQSGDQNITTKSRALLVLFQLTKKYPELSNELKLCLEDQMDQYSESFRKRVQKTLKQLEVSHEN